MASIQFMKADAPQIGGTGKIIPITTDFKDADYPLNMEVRSATFDGNTVTPGTTILIARNGITKGQYFQLDGVPVGGANVQVYSVANPQNRLSGNCQIGIQLADGSVIYPIILQWPQ